MNKAASQQNQTRAACNRGVVSLNLVTSGYSLWLLRSRPDQIRKTKMRGGPPLAIVSEPYR
jgi:hypothetical protein